MLKEQILWSTSNREIFAPRYIARCTHFYDFHKTISVPDGYCSQFTKINVHEITIFV